MKNKKMLITLLIIFISLTILIFTNNTKLFDNKIYSFIISFKSNQLTNFMKTMTNFSSVKVTIIISLLALTSLLWKNKKGLYLDIVVAVTFIINYILKIIFRRPRPTILRLINETGYSFPSGHSMISLGLYGFIIYLIYQNKNINKYFKILTISLLSIIIILIGISRIYLGVHYPSDVLGGYLMSSIILIVLTTIYRKK